MNIEGIQVESGFFKRLFDFSFKEFITIKIISVLYMISIIGAGLWSLVILFGGVASGKFGGVVGGLVLAPVAFILAVIFSRIWLETVIVLFRIAENTGKMVSSAAPGENK